MKTKAWYQGASASLIVTFILGVGVGFGLCYAVLELMREEIQQNVAVSVQTPPVVAPQVSASEPPQPPVEVAEAPEAPETPAEPVTIEVPEPVAPQTKIMPTGLTKLTFNSSSVRWSNPKVLISSTVLDLSNTLNTTFSPRLAGRTETRKSTSLELYVIFSLPS